MTIAGKNQKANFVEVSSEQTDLTGVAPVAYSSLSALTAEGFTGVSPTPNPVGFANLTMPYARFPVGTLLYSRDTGRFWAVQAGTTTARVLVLVSDGSASSSSGGGSSGADIVLVVAKSATYTSPALSTAVFSTIAAAITAAPTGAAILILNDTYTETLTVGKVVSLIGFSNAQGVTISGPMSITVTTGAVTLRNLTVAGGSSAAVTLSTGAVMEAFNCSFTGATATIAQGGAATARLTQSTVTGGIIVSTQVLTNTSTTAATTAATNMTANTCVFTGAVSSAISLYRNCSFASTLSITGTSSTLTMNECNVTGNFTSAITGAVTVRNATWSAGCTFAGAVTLIGCAGLSTMTAPSLTAHQLNVTGLLTTNGTLSLNESSFLGGVTYTGTTGSVTAEGCRFVGTMTFTRSVTARQCSFTRTTAGSAVSITSAAAQTSRFEGCIISSSSGNGIAVAANDTCVVSNNTWNVSTFIATAGAGTTQCVGDNPGGARFNTTNVTSSVSAMMVYSQLTTSISGANTMTVLGGGASNPIRDTWSLSAGDAYPTLASLTFYPGSEIPDGWRVTVRNTNLQNSLQLLPSGSDTLSAETIIPPNSSRTYQYVRSGSLANIIGVA